MIARRAVGRVLARVVTVLAAAGRLALRLVAYASARGAYALAYFRSGHGVGHRINVATRGLRRVVFRLMAPVRRRQFDRIVCGADAIDALLAPMPAQPRPRVTYAERFDALDVTTALGIDDPAEHDPRRAIVDADVQRALATGAARLEHIEDAATVRVSGAPGRLDAVADLIVPTCTRAMEVFLGLGTGRGDEVFQWAQLALHRVFLSPPLPTGSHDWLAETTARRACDRLADALDDAIDLADPLRTTGGLAGPEVASALADGAGELTPEDKGRLMGYALSLGPHLAWACAYVLDELLRRPEHLHVFAPEPDGTAGNVTDQRNLVLEALRFNPPTRFVARILSAELTLTSGGEPLRHVGPGIVAVYTGSADFDSRRWTHPLRFDPTRHDPNSPEPHRPPYGFSSGIHACPGVDLAPELIVRVLRPLLRTRDLHRARGRDGRLSTRLDRWHPLREAGRWRLPTSLTVTYHDDVPAWRPGDLSPSWPHLAEAPALDAGDQSERRL